MAPLGSLVAAVLLTAVHAFRVVNVTDVSQLAQVPAAVFPPYAHGFVGYYGDPSTTFFREHINSGAIFNPELPTQWNDMDIYQKCPGMVGPFSDGEYYCVGKEYGFCDQRSSTCWCNKGYQGLNCTQCIPEYFMQGGLCYPKKNCPRDCSGQGSCDYSTGLCTCNSFRIGLDCSQQSCLRFDPLCTSCSSNACLACAPGFFPTNTNSCQSCVSYDPRCVSCDAARCLSCADFLLNSIRRSGARNTIDPPVPAEEVNREFSFTFVYGSQEPKVFDEAEPYALVASMPPGRACTQGTSLDASWLCTPQPQSHVVCGHLGTFAFVSPTYEVRENGAWIPLTVTRTGGGYGPVSVAYELVHGTTTTSDVSATAFYTSSQRLAFAPGVVSVTFYITIHDNFVATPNKCFYVVLRDPSAGTTIGNQGTTVVTILENDPLPPVLTLHVAAWGVVGAPFQLQVTTSVTASAPVVVVAEATLLPPVRYVDNDLERITLAYATNTWRNTWTPSRSGNYSITFYNLFANGLQGVYYSNAWLQGPIVATRVDKMVNFTWMADDPRWNSFHYGSARWTGYIQAIASELTYFIVDTTGSFRLWLNGKLLIDAWLPLDTQRWGAAVLQQNVFYTVQLDYRHGTALSTRLNLQWQSASVPLQTIQPLFVAQTIGTTLVTMVEAPPVQVLFRGTASGVAGTPFVFSFTPIDAFGNLRRYVADQDAFRSVLQANAQVNVDIAIAFNGTRLVAQGTPVVSGLYTLHLYLNQVEVIGFPMTVQIAPSTLTGPRSLVSGAGLAPTGVIAAAPVTIAIQGYDIFGNRMTQGGGHFQVRATSVAQSLVDLGSVVDNRDGTYVATYTPRFIGTYSIEITINKLQVAQSPYSITVAPNTPYGPTCHYVSGTGLTSATTGVSATFVIQLRDINSNLLSVGSAVVAMSFNLAVVSASCNTLFNGQYSCQYTPTVASPSMQLVASVNSLPIRGSPFTIPVITGTAAGLVSTANGTGLSYAFAGAPTLVNIQAKDIRGNNRMAADTLTPSMTFADASPATTTSFSSQYIGFGYYGLTYTVLTAGTYLLHIAINGVEIANSPFAVTVYPVAADKTTTTAAFVSPTPFVAGTTLVANIQPRDVYGNPVNTNYRFDLDPLSTITSATPALYTISMTPIQSGVYTFQPRIYLPGGGNLTAFATVDWSGPPTLTQSPTHLGINYGLHMPPLTDAMRAFSVIWDGYLLPAFSEDYMITVTLTGCQLFVQWNAAVVLNLTSVGTGSFTRQATANQFVSLQIWWSKAPDVAAPTAFNLTWSSLSQPTQAIPPSALYSRWPIKSLSPTFAVYPSAPSPANFQLRGLPTQWTAGVAQTFTVVAKDMYGNIRDRGGDSLQLLVTGFNQPPVSYSVVAIADGRNGSYAVTLVSFTSGALSLTVGVNAQPFDPAISLAGFDSSLSDISSNPFPLVVAPAAPVLASTVWAGLGLVSGVAGAVQSFTIVLVDAFQNVAAGPLPALALVLVANALTVACTWTYDPVAQLYTVTYMPTVATVYTVQLSVGGTSPVVVAPSQPTILPNVAVASTSQVMSPSSNSLTISLNDAYANPLRIGGNLVSVTLAGAASVVADVIDRLDGTYTATFVLPLPGLYETTTLLMAPPQGLVGAYYAAATSPAPESQRIDGTINLTGLDAAKIIWTGFLLGTFTEMFQFHLTGVRLFLDGVERVASDKVLLVEGRLHAIRVEATHAPVVYLGYESARTPSSVVPAAVLCPSGAEIAPRLRF
ncbi:Aste57867_9647 [Aphanomyces stellatus]|uniref:Aste57867_9647 protein n=1 Tax=Aphanomyces stellatus TaxID=120398 RepID=A0A485KNT5_9STRA|nr:hypothetical protein As57867_009609 [Aphanomyces stellatus]VFT86526.1 Aste57867_9647 [Aphanomyces stellatus]